MSLEKSLHANDVRMIEPGQRARLCQESIQAGLIVISSLGIGECDSAAIGACNIRRRKILLYRDILIEVRVMRQISNAETAHPKHGNEVILHQHRVKRQCIRVLWLRHKYRISMRF